MSVVSLQMAPNVLPVGASQQPLLDLDGIKALFRKGMQHAKDKYFSVVFPKNNALCDYQLDRVNAAQDLSTLMNAIWLGNNNATWCNSFWSPKAICDGCEIRYTGIQFGYGQTGWYFFYGITGNFCFNLSFFRQEIAPPDVVEIDRGEAVRWLVLGGYGTIPNAGDVVPQWFSLQPEWIYMKYTQPSYSTFTLIGQGTTKAISLSSVDPMSFLIDMTFTDTNGASHSFKTTLRANTPPTPNFPNSCLCGYGLGTFYYSYTDMSCTFAVNNGAESTGKAWTDHQYVRGGIPNSTYMQALAAIGPQKVSSGWLWFALQDEQSGLQYMLTHFFADAFYQKDILGRPKNNSIPMDIINVYKEGKTYFLPEDPIMNAKNLNVVLAQTVSVNGLDMPAAYNITLPGGKRVVLKIATAPNVYPTSFAPYETPAFLYTPDGQKIGYGLIEANFYLDNKTLAQRMIASAGGNAGDPTQVNLILDVLNKKINGWRKFLAVLIVLLPLWILLTAILFVMYKKEMRGLRMGLVVAILMLLYLMVNMVSSGVN